MLWLKHRVLYTLNKCCTMELYSYPKAKVIIFIVWYDSWPKLNPSLSFLSQLQECTWNQNLKVRAQELVFEVLFFKNLSCFLPNLSMSTVAWRPMGMWAGTSQYLALILFSGNRNAGHKENVGFHLLKSCMLMRIALFVSCKGYAWTILEWKKRDRSRCFTVWVVLFQDNTWAIFFLTQDTSAISMTRDPFLLPAECLSVGFPRIQYWNS